MNPFISGYKKIYLSSATLAVVLQGFVLNNISILPANIPFANIIEQLLKSTTIYLCLQKALIVLYEKYLWKILHKQYNISGSWYHTFRDNNDENYCRIGKTEIRQSINEINISGVNVNNDFDFRKLSQWKSTSVSLDATGEIIFSYTNTRVGKYTDKDDALNKKDGVMHVRIERNKFGVPYQIIGMYHDSIPSIHRGDVVWRRKEDWSDEFEKANGNRKGK